MAVSTGVRTTLTSASPATLRTTCGILFRPCRKLADLKRERAHRTCTSNSTGTPAGEIGLTAMTVSVAPCQPKRSPLLRHDARRAIGQLVALDQRAVDVFLVVCEHRRRGGVVGMRRHTRARGGVVGAAAVPL